MCENGPSIVADFAISIPTSLLASFHELPRSIRQLAQPMYWPASFHTDLARLQANQLQGLRTVLDKADNWDFDIFELELEADGLPLQVGRQMTQ